MAHTSQNSHSDPKIILGVAAHPDDLEFSAGGAIAGWIKRGATAYFLVLTDGSKGAAGASADRAHTATTRQLEQREAARRMGVSDVFFCNYEDGALTVSMDVKKDIVRVIRSVRPDTVITMDPTVVYDAERGTINHPDHRAAGQAVLDAVYPLARDVLNFPDLKDEHMQPHNVATVLLTNPREYNFFVDISTTLGQKIHALLAHKSQIQDSSDVSKTLTTIAAQTGKSCGMASAEGFARIDVVAS